MNILLTMNTSLLLHIGFIHYLSLTVTGDGNIRWQYFHRPGNIAIVGDDFRTDAKSLSRLVCLSMCTSCQAVSFNEVTKECRHYTQEQNVIVPVVGNSSASALWISQRMKLSAAQYTDSRQMDFEEATELCQLMGGQLATYRQLSDAREDGFHLCSCGWLSDSTARFVLNYDDPTCDHQQTAGLHTCKIVNNNGQRVYDTHYPSAYCTFAV